MSILHPHFPPIVVSGVYHWLVAGYQLNETERRAAKRVAASAIHAVAETARGSHKGWIKQAKRFIAKNDFIEPIELPCKDEEKRRDLCLRLIIYSVKRGRGGKNAAQIEYELDCDLALERKAA